MKFKFIILSLLILLSCFIVESKTLSGFGYNTGVGDSDFYKVVNIYDLTSSVQYPEDVEAVTVSSKDSNLADLKNLTHLKYLYLDETFFLSSVNLKKQKVEIVFSILSELHSLQYVSTYDPNLLIQISRLKYLRGLRCNTFDNTLFNSLKNEFSNLEILIVNDPVAEVVNVSGLGYLKQLEIYSMYMSNLDESVCQALTLQALRIQPGKMESLPKSFTRLKNLIYFSLTGAASFEGFPYPVLSLKNIETLELDLREARTLPKGIADFKKLKKIILAEARRMKVFPEELSRLPVLETISLSNADAIVNVSSLLKFNHPFTLILNRCDYVQIAKWIRDCPMLKSFVVPKSIFKKDLERLKSLIQENKLILADI